MPLRHILLSFVTKVCKSTLYLIGPKVEKSPSKFFAIFSSLLFLLTFSAIFSRCLSVIVSVSAIATLPTFRTAFRFHLLPTRSRSRYRMFLSVSTGLVCYSRLKALHICVADTSLRHRRNFTCQRQTSLLRSSCFTCRRLPSLLRSRYFTPALRWGGSV